jgi:hypothetical protein
VESKWQLIENDEISLIPSEHQQQSENPQSVDNANQHISQEVSLPMTQDSDPRTQEGHLQAQQ